MDELFVERSIWIAAPRERVWQAITDPQQVRQWFSPGVEWKSRGSGLGATMSMVDPASGVEMYTQVIEGYEPPRRVAMRASPPLPDSPQVTAWTLEEENGGTRVTVRESGYEAMSSAARQARM